MGTEELRERAQQELIGAETALTRALQQLAALRRAALYGRYDVAEFDRAVVAYRQAEVRAQEARHTWAVVNERPDAVSPPAAPQAASEPGYQPQTARELHRWQFVRWLVQQGRLTDELPEVAAAGTLEACRG